MLELSQRVFQQQLVAFAAHGVIPVLRPRIVRLLSSGRPMILVHRIGDPDELDAIPGLRVFEGGLRAGVEFTADGDRDGFSVNLGGGVQMIGAHADRRAGSEEQVADRWSARRKACRQQRRLSSDGFDATRIRVVGDGTGPLDCLEVLTYNENCVREQTSVFFQYEDHQLRAERDAVLLRSLAARGIGRARPSRNWHSTSATRRSPPSKRPSTCTPHWEASPVSAPLSGCGLSPPFSLLNWKDDCHGGEKAHGWRCFRPVGLRWCRARCRCAGAGLGEFGFAGCPFVG
ncbi:hypothetical protein ACWDUL_21025 [Nocardia niigatensis]